MFVIIQVFFFFFHRYSRVLWGDLATKQGTNSCERRQQAGCMGGNFTSSHYGTYVLCLHIIWCHVLLCAVFNFLIEQEGDLTASARCHYLCLSLSYMDHTLSWVRQTKVGEERHMGRELEIRLSQKSVDYYLFISWLFSWSQPVLSL